MRGKRERVNGEGMKGEVVEREGMEGEVKREGM